MARDVVAEIQRATRRKFKAEDKIRIVLEGLRGEISVPRVGVLDDLTHIPHPFEAKLGYFWF